MRDGPSDWPSCWTPSVTLARWRPRPDFHSRCGLPVQGGRHQSAKRSRPKRSPRRPPISIGRRPYVPRASGPPCAKHCTAADRVPRKRWRAVSMRRTGLARRTDHHALAALCLSQARPWWPASARHPLEDTGVLGQSLEASKRHVRAAAGGQFESAGTCSFCRVCAFKTPTRRQIPSPSQPTGWHAKQQTLNSTAPAADRDIR